LAGCNLTSALRSPRRRGKLWSEVARQGRTMEMKEMTRIRRQAKQVATQRQKMKGEKKERVEVERRKAKREKRRKELCLRVTVVKDLEFLQAHC
jgi:hypothetical protein